MHRQDESRRSIHQTLQPSGEHCVQDIYIYWLDQGWVIPALEGCCPACFASISALAPSDYWDQVCLVNLEYINMVGLPLLHMQTLWQSWVGMKF